MTEAAGRILFVDDEPNVLSGYRRTLRGRYSVVTADSGEAGLGELNTAAQSGNPFHVVVSDMRMPNMNGAEFLAKVRDVQPECIQMLLSGQADLESTIAAVNDGNLFRFLHKPCSPQDLDHALTAALRQYQLVGSEQELLERTLTGMVDVLTQVLALASKEVIARTDRVRSMIGVMIDALDERDWRLPLAAMLSQVGCIAVPPAVLEKVQKGLLAHAERDVFLGHPATGRQLLERIPRLEDIARWIGEQTVAVRGAPLLLPDRPPTTDRAEVIFRLVHDYLAHYDLDHDQARCVAAVTGQATAELTAALTKAADQIARSGGILEIDVPGVRPGMVLAEEVRTATRVVVFNAGERFSDAMVKRLLNYARTTGVMKPIKVLEGD